MFKGIIRELKRGDIDQVQKIFELYWTDEGFLEKLKSRLSQFVEGSEEAKEQAFKYFVAEDNGEIVGIAISRKAPPKMKKYTVTDNPAEFYVLASKYRRKGIGTALRTKRIEEAKKDGYTEIVFFSPDSHKESWVFHDNSEFERVGPTEVDGEAGMIWRIVL